jgi:hypothetical protein
VSQISAEGAVHAQQLGRARVKTDDPLPEAGMKDELPGVSSLDAALERPDGVPGGGYGKSCEARRCTMTHDNRQDNQGIGLTSHSGGRPPSVFCGLLNLQLLHLLSQSGSRIEAE